MLTKSTSSLFSSLGIQTDLQEYVPAQSDSRSSGRRFRQSVGDFAEVLNQLVETADSSVLEARLQQVFASAVNQISRSASTTANQQLQAFGLNLSANDDKSLLTIDKAQLSAAMRQRGSTTDSESCFETWLLIAFRNNSCKNTTCNALLRWRYLNVNGARKN